jgi:hypothetical protein
MLNAEQVRDGSRDDRHGDDKRELEDLMEQLNKTPVDITWRLCLTPHTCLTWSLTRSTQ